MNLKCAISSTLRLIIYYKTWMSKTSLNVLELYSGPYQTYDGVSSAKVVAGIYFCKKTSS